MTDTPREVARGVAEVACDTIWPERVLRGKNDNTDIAIAHALDAAGVAEALEKLKKAHVLASRLTPDHTIEELIGLAMLALMGNDDET